MTEAVTAPKLLLAMRTLIRHVTSLYLTLMVLAGVPSGAGPTVVCMGSDGHLAIEVGWGRCVEGPSGPCTAPGAESFNVVPDPCGPCVDLPMGNAALKAAPHVSNIVGQSASPAAPILWATADVDAMRDANRDSRRVGTTRSKALSRSRRHILRN